jgi:Multicopper oxidase
VVGSGDGIYDPSTDVSTYNLVNPVLRDTVTLWPLQWVAVRIVADNPGVWFFHCHIFAHEGTRSRTFPQIRGEANHSLRCAYVDLFCVLVGSRVHFFLCSSVMGMGFHLITQPELVDDPPLSVQNCDMQGLSPGVTLVGPGSGGDLSTTGNGTKNSTGGTSSVRGTGEHVSFTAAILIMLATAAFLY